MNRQKRADRIGSMPVGTTLILLQVALLIIPSLSSARDNDEAEIVIEPLNVVASFMLNGKEMGPIPAIITIPEEMSTFTLTLNKEGYPPVEGVFIKRQDGWVTKDAHFPGRICVAYDFDEKILRHFTEKQIKQILKELGKQGYKTKDLPDENVLILLDWASVKTVVYKKGLPYSPRISVPRPSVR